MRQQRDLIGQVFSKGDAWIKVLEETEPYVSPKGRTSRRHTCLCGSCETVFTAHESSILSGKTTSCGCRARNAAFRNRMDLVGQVFGNDEHWIEVLSEAPAKVSKAGNRARRYNCRCKCGREFIARQSNIISGHTTSCGQGACRHSGKKRKNVVGMRFGNDINWVEVIEDAESHRQPNGKVRRMVKCICCCGNEFTTYLESLTAGLCISCGCSRKAAGERKRFDLTGMRFGDESQWVDAIEIDGYYIAPNGAKQIMWKCRCKCGNIFSTIGSNLTSGRTTSCGCVHSKGEVKITQILNSINVQNQRQKKFPTCINPATNANLYFDFEVQDNLLIEFDGLQHFQAIDNDLFDHAATKRRDNIKNQWCRENNKQLIRIPYTELPRIDAAYMLTLMRLAAMEEDEELVCPV